jgi:hypothetical protein
LPGARTSAYSVAGVSPQLPALFEDVYGEASRETRLSLANFPEDCPFSVEQALDAGYWPE